MSARWSLIACSAVLLTGWASLPRVAVADVPGTSPRMAVWPGSAARLVARAGETSPPVSAPKARSADLGRPVTLRANGEPVVDLLRDLSDQAGRQMTAEAELGERRMHAWVRELPEASVRRGLAQVVHGLWLRKSGGDTLRLEPDGSASRDQDAALARRRRQFFSGLRRLVSQLSLSRAEIERQIQTGSLGAGYLLRPESRAAVQLTSLLSEAQWRELEGTGRVSVNPDQLGPAGPSLLREYTQHMNEVRKQAAKVGLPGMPAPPLLDPEQTSRGPLSFAVIPEPGGAPFGMLSVGFATEVGSGGLTITGLFRGTTGPSRWIDASGSPGETVPKGSPVTVRFRQPPGAWGDVVRAVAEQLRLPVVSEEYSRGGPPVMPLSAEVSGLLPEVFDRLAGPFGYEWRRKGGIYQFRSVTWYADREREPPGTLVKAALAAREKKQPLSLEWLASAAGLPHSRLFGLWMSAPAAQMVVPRFQTLLRFYATLSPAQRAELASGEGMAPERLSAEQREALQAVIRRLAREWPAEAISQAHVRVTHRPDQARFVFTAEGKSVEAVVPLPSSAGRLPGFPGVPLSPMPGP